MPRRVFLTGSTGYLGSRLARLLVDRGHEVRALVRPGSAPKVPAGCRIVIGNALREDSFVAEVGGCDTFVALVGVPHPSPARALQFREIDLASARAGIAAAARAGVAHFVYGSVAHPAPIMKAYWEARAEAENVLRSTEIPSTVLRPWYVLGPGHRWAEALAPAYWLLERLPATRESARRLGLVRLRQMIAALVNAVENPAREFRVVEVPEIRASRLS